MTVTRNQIYEALLELGGSSSIGFSEKGRRLREFDAAQKPALFQIEHVDSYQAKAGQLRHRTLKVTWVMYHEVGRDPNTVPAVTTADMLDALDALFPDAIGPCKQTLGGLVHSVWIDGTVQKFEGDLDGQTIIVVPITISIP